MNARVDRLNRMTIRATSPDRQIQVMLADGDRFTVAFLPGAYSGYRERVLEQQLAQLATEVWSGYRRGCHAVVSELTGRRATVVVPVGDSQRRRFQEARARLSCVGRSQRNLIQVEAVGLLRWRFEIRDGALSLLGEQQFLDELGAAVQAMLADFSAKMIALKDRYFGLDLVSGREPPETTATGLR